MSDITPPGLGHPSIKFQQHLFTGDGAANMLSRLGEESHRRGDLSPLRNVHIMEGTWMQDL